MYCGVSLRWNYPERFVDSSMPGYSKKQLKKCNNICKRKAHALLKPLQQKYGQAAQEPLLIDDSKPLDKEGKKSSNKPSEASCFMAALKTQSYSTL